VKILVDMNLSPVWCGVLRDSGWETIHWSNVGNPTAPDSEIMAYAKNQGYVVLTHDLDFSAILAATQAQAPSVIQIRTQDVLSERFRALLIGALHQFQDNLSAGALIVVDESRARARLLPLR